MEKVQKGEVIVENKNPQVLKLTLVINSEILQKIKKEKISINQLFILTACYQEASYLLDIYDGFSMDQEVLIFDYQDLVLHGFLQETGEELVAELYKLTPAGKELIEEIYELVGPVEDESEEINLRAFCNTYLELWPKVKLPSNKYARSSVLEIEKKMKTWLRTYKSVFKKDYNTKLTNQDILDVTKAYIDRYSKDGYRFMVTSSYFIQKNEKSSLADELFAKVQGIDKTPSEKTNITTM